MPPDAVLPPTLLPPDWPAALAGGLADPGPRELPLDGNRASAVLIAFLHRPTGPTLLLVRKSERLNNHAGQVGFPGGSADPTDSDLQATALREAWEEVGLSPGRVQILGRLDDERTYVTSYHIRPFVAWVPDPPALFVADPHEIADILELPLHDLLTTAPVSWLELASGGKVYRIPRYEWPSGLVVWGATARLLWNLQQHLAPWSAQLPPLVDPDDNAF
jgi:8-oxo-dGTP pyrophosphatase MutT (NUDIX family)